MIKDCLRVFEKELARKGDALVLDNYIPKNGTYIIVTIKKNSFVIGETVKIFYDRKNDVLEGESDIRYRELQKLDYYSKLVEMNKPIDPKKHIHSNNYLSFFVKKENLAAERITPDTIDGYYNTLKNPFLKYANKAKTKEIYHHLAIEIGEPDIVLIERIQKWMKENFFALDIDVTAKDYLKIFFVFEENEKTLERYKIEGKRYLIPNIYNNNDFNINIDGEIYGVPNNNMGMNVKKPYLEHKNRKVKEPYFLNLEEVLLQEKFFDYLMGKASVGYVNVYIDTVEDKISFLKANELLESFKNGIFIRIKKGKEVEIHNFDIIAGYEYYLDPEFKLKEMIEIPDKEMNRFKAGYSVKTNLKELQHLIDEVFFGKMLCSNYFTDPEKISINDGILKFNLLLARERLFNWLYKGNQIGIDALLRKISLELIKNTIENEYYIKVMHQVNLRMSLIDYFNKNSRMEEIMVEARNNLRIHLDCKEDWQFESEKEYYYAVGQLIAFYISKINSLKKPQSLINPFLNAKSDAVIKRRLRNFYKKVNHAFEKNNLRVDNLIEHVMGYCPNSVSVDQDILITGFVASSLIYKKKEEDNEDE